MDLASSSMCPSLPALRKEVKHEQNPIRRELMIIRKGLYQTCEHVQSQQDLQEQACFFWQVA